MHIGNMAILISLVAKRGDATRKAVTVVPSSPFLSIVVFPRKQIFWALHCNLLAADTDKYQGGYQELDIESRTDNQSGCRFRPPSGPRTRRPFSPHESPSGSGRTGRTDEPKRCHLLSLPCFCSITFRSQSPLRPTTRHRTDGGDAQQRRWRQDSSARLRSEISRSTGHAHGGRHLGGACPGLVFAPGRLRTGGLCCSDLGTRRDFRHLPSHAEH